MDFSALKQSIKALKQIMVWVNFLCYEQGQVQDRLSKYIAKKDQGKRSLIKYNI